MRIRLLVRQVSILTVLRDCIPLKLRRRERIPITRTGWNPVLRSRRDYACLLKMKFGNIGAALSSLKSDHLG